MTRSLPTQGSPRRRHLRLALPPLAQLHAESPCAFALFDRKQVLLRAGELPLARIAQDVPKAPLYVILAPQDAVVVRLPVPPLPARQLDAAVRFAVEPLALSDVDALCIAHGPRDAQGQVTAAWVDRQALARAWAQLAAAHLDVTAIIPHALAVPADDAQPQQPLQLPADARWTTPLPSWSLAHSALRPAQAARPWRGLITLAAATTLLWLGGFSIYATRQAREMTTLQADMVRMVRETFPHIPVVIAPLKQASAARDALRVSQGLNDDAGFLALALAAAQTLDFAAQRVQSLHYVDGALSLTLAEGYTPPANEAALAQAAARQSLALEKDAIVAHTWRVRRADAANTPAPTGAQRP